MPRGCSQRLAELLPCFGVEAREAEIRACFELVCGGSLGVPAERSSLNSDGTPLQFALTLVAGQRTSFEFVGEAFAAQMDFAARRALGIVRMRAVAAVLDLTCELAAVQPYVEALTSAQPAEDQEDPVGAFWIGATFPASGPTALTVYANARRGPEPSRWQRLADFMTHFGVHDSRSSLRALQARGLRPLGGGVQLRAGEKPRMRVYCGAYGVRPSAYRALFRELQVDAEFERELEGLFAVALGEPLYPTRSAVVSLGCDQSGAWFPKLELCAHCAWRTDAEAATHCQQWLECLGADVALYRKTLAILSRERESMGAPAAHAYVGVGMKRAQSYASLYFNPGSQA